MVSVWYDVIVVLVCKKMIIRVKSTRNFELPFNTWMVFYHSFDSQYFYSVIRHCMHVQYLRVYGDTQSMNCLELCQRTAIHIKFVQVVYKCCVGSKNEHDEFTLKGCSWDHWKCHQFPLKLRFLDFCYCRVGTYICKGSVK